MRSRTVFMLFVLISPSLFAQSSLWSKAVDILAANLDWLPATVTMQFEMVDKDGQADMVTTSTFKVSLDDDGEVQSELVKMVRDGEDVTKKEVEKQQKQRAKAEAKVKVQVGENGDDSEENSVAFSLTDSPFHPDNQGKIQLTPLDEKKTIDGIVCQRFDYRLPLAENSRIGTVWLDAETGAPVLHEFTTEPLPPRVREMTNSVRFRYTPNGDFYTTQANFVGVGGFLFIKKSFRGSITFADYWRHPTGEN